MDQILQFMTRLQKNKPVSNDTFDDPSVDLTSPTVTSASIDGDTLTINFNEEIDSTVPKANSFKVKNGRKKIKVEAVSVDTDADTVVLSLKDAVEANDNEVTLDYKTKKKDQVTGVIQDLAGNDLQSIKALPVTNITPASDSSETTQLIHQSLRYNSAIPSQFIFALQGVEAEVPFSPFIDPLA